MCVCGVYLCVTLFLVSVLVVMLLATPTSGSQVGRRGMRMEKRWKKQKKNGGGGGGEGLWETS